MQSKILQVNFPTSIEKITLQ